MNTKIVITSLIAATLLLPVAGYAADSTAVGDSDRSSPKAYVKDSAITVKIHTALAKEKFSTLVRIGVDTDDHGAVRLSGYSHSQEAADKAVTIARAVEGVTSVQSTIQIRPDK